MSNTRFPGILLIFCLALPACFDLWSESDDEYDGDNGTGGGGSTTCDDTGDGDWNATWAAKECRVFEIVNQRRGEGGDCGSGGSFGPASPLKLQSSLTEAARLHSRDMGERDYFSHESPGGPNGDDMVDRIENAGYVGWNAIGENIAAGLASAEDTVAGWMQSPGHCANILSPDFTQIGIGYVEVQGSKHTHYWTQDFGRR